LNSFGVWEYPTVESKDKPKVIFIEFLVIILE
jgi:hypothetical protein